MKGTIRISTLLICAFATGCTLFPRKADLAAVHDAYRADFANFIFANSPDNLPCGNSAAFDRTLEAIRSFEAKYRGETSAEMGHVTVLKGMLHVQAGNFGIARELKDKVASASIAASDDRNVRDVLFKQAYPDLVNGWQAACESVRPDSPTVVRDGAFSIDQRKLSEALGESAANVAQVIQSSLERKARPGVESDDGAIYLATTAGIFSYYRFRMADDRCRVEPDMDACSTRKRTEFAPELEPHIKAIRTLLTEEELKAAEMQSQCPPTNESKTWNSVPTRWRQRYVSWYLELQGKRTCKQ